MVLLAPRALTLDPHIFLQLQPISMPTNHCNQPPIKIGRDINMSFRTPAADHLDTSQSRTKIPRITGQLLDRTRCCPNIGTNDVGAQIDGFILASGTVGAEMMRKLF